MARAWSAWVVAAMVWLTQTAPAMAITVELNDVAGDRIERQIAAAEGQLPLAGAPDVGHFQGRLAAKGLKLGSAVFIRVFKAESELEVWLDKGGRFEHFATYPVCQWSGTIGPKTQSGDKQTPEGFYTVSRRQLHRSARHPRSLNLGFPNPFDRSMSRTGDYILVHGGCASVGCFAMTDTLVEEIFALTEAAIKQGGQNHVPVHVFPFRFTAANLEAHAASEWRDFWLNLKEGHDAFEATRVPPRVGVCEKRYVFQSLAPGEGADSGPLAACGAMVAAKKVRERLSALAGDPPPLPLRKPAAPSTTAMLTTTPNLDAPPSPGLAKAEAVAAALGDQLVEHPEGGVPLPTRPRHVSSPATACSAATADCDAAFLDSTQPQQNAMPPASPKSRAQRGQQTLRSAPDLPGRMSLGLR